MLNQTISSVASGLAARAIQQALKEGKVIEIPSLDIAFAEKPYCVKYRREEFVAFDTAHDVAIFLWGKYLPKCRIWKNGKRVQLTVAEITEIEKELKAA